MGATGAASTFGVTTAAVRIAGVFGATLTPWNFDIALANIEEENELRDIDCA